MRSDIIVLQRIIWNGLVPDQQEVGLAGNTSGLWKEAQLS